MGRVSEKGSNSRQTLLDKTVLIAGGTGGLGCATSILLARDGAGVVAGYRSDRDRAEQFRKKALEESGCKIDLVQGDIQDPDVRRHYVESALVRNGRLYGLVCFTGNPARVPFDQATDDNLLTSLRDNYVAPILLAREAARAMRESGESGAIVLISSMQASAPFESSVNYAGAKAALNYAARIMAKQWGGRQGIRVNVVAPGVNRAGMALQSISSGKYDFFVEEGIIPRFGEAADVARVVRLLMEPDNYMTGQIITVDGGLTLRRDRR